MIAKDENLLVKLIKKSVGLPTGQSGCCGPAAPAAQDCCNTTASEQASKDCGCTSTASREEEPPEQS